MSALTLSTGTTNANGSEPKTPGQLLALRWRVSNKPWLLRFVRQGCSERERISLFTNWIWEKPLLAGTPFVLDHLRGQEKSSTSVVQYSLPM